MSTVTENVAYSVIAHESFTHVSGQECPYSRPYRGLSDMPVCIFVF